LTNPIYIGQAAYGKTQAVPAKKSKRRSDGKKITNVLNSSRIRKPKSLWLIIKSPAIIEEEIFGLVQKKLAQNKKEWGRFHSKHNYLSSGLVRCKGCNYALYVNRSGEATNRLSYYRCPGCDKRRFPEGRRCWAKQVRIEVLDDLVWDQVKKLVRNPCLTLAEYNKRVFKQMESHNKVDGLISNKIKEIKRKEIEKKRLLDLYQLGLVKKEEVVDRLETIRSTVRSIENEIEQIKNQKINLNKQLSLIEEFEQFKEKINLKLENISFEEKKKITRLVVNEIIVDSSQNNIEIRHILPTLKASHSCLDGACFQLVFQKGISIIRLQRN
jgi:site-specific DNA recombinase